MDEELDELNPGLKELDVDGDALGYAENLPEIKSQLRHVFNSLFNPASTPFSNPCQAVTHRVVQLVSSDTQQLVPIYINLGEFKIQIHAPKI